LLPPDATTALEQWDEDCHSKFDQEEGFSAKSRALPEESDHKGHQEGGIQANSTIELVLRGTSAASGLASDLGSRPTWI
jgi:hypothetical protein